MRWRWRLRAMAKANRKQRAHQRGLWAEFAIMLYFRLKGYRVLARRYKTPVGEIDLVVVRRKTLIFAEVKAHRQMQNSLQAVDAQARRRIERAAMHFLAHHPVYAGHDMRFDVLALATPFSFTHLDNAWQPRS
jgi:putative endonuclease